MVYDPVDMDGDKLKPLFLIDVDGVVNAWPRVPDEDYHYIDSFGMRVAVHPETLEALRVVSGLASELLWLSAWRGRANHEINTYLSQEIDDWPISLGVITDGTDTGNMSTNWKLGAMLTDWRVTRAMGEGRPVIWIEDFGFDYGKFGAEYRERVTETGVTAIDTTRRGYLNSADLRKAGLIPKIPVDWVEEAAEGPLEVKAIVTRKGWRV